jgi:hypothetical protein
VLTVHPAAIVAMPAEEARAVRVRAEPVGASFLILWDDLMGTRLATMPEWPAPIVINAALDGSEPFDVASDGVTIAIPSDATTISFFGVADGAAMGTQSFPTGLATDPVTAGVADYIVAFRDSFDHELAHVTPAIVGAMRAAPSQGSGLPLRIDETPLGPLVTRFDATGLRRMGAGVFALVLPETLDAVRVDFPPTTVSAGATGQPISFDVITSAAGTAVITNFGANGAVLAVLACQPH